MKIEWPIRIALLIAISSYAFTFQQWVGAAFAGILLLLSCLSFRIEVDRIGQMIFALFGLGAAYVLAVSIGPRPKHAISEAFALSQAFFSVWLLLYSGFRLLLKNPWGGHRGTVFAALVAIFACGGTVTGKIYHLHVALFTIFALWAMVNADPSRPSLRNSTPKRKKILILSLIIFSVFAVSSVLSLPSIYVWVTGRLDFSFLSRTQTGFDMYMKIGSLSQMIQSKKIVLRVQGPPQPDLRLRGAVYNRYSNKYWIITRKEKPKSFKVRNLIVTQKSKPRFTIKYVSGDSDRYFTALKAKNLATKVGKVRVDSKGILYPLPEQFARRISFELGAKVSIPQQNPEKKDYQIPKKIRAQIEKKAKAWIKELQDPEQKMNRLTRRLKAGFKYSLSFQRPKKEDPVLNFLYKNKQGHCEYFASALALLGRSVGVPTRVIGGYRVSEYNHLGYYFIVREQNAHAWVEAWLPEKGWTTFDATPASGVSVHMPNTTGTFTGLIDLLRVSLNRLREKLAQLTLFQLFITISIFVGLWILIRLLRRFRNKRTNEIIKEAEYSKGLPAFEDFLAALSSISPKKSSETIEGYARRLKTEQKEVDEITHRLLADYASYRYGKHGDSKELGQRLQNWLARSLKQNL